MDSDPSSDNCVEKDLNNHKRKRTGHCRQAYITQWEQRPEFKSWLSNDPNNRYSAYCKACHCQVQSRVATLKKHLYTLKHKSAMLTYKPNPTTEGCSLATRIVKKKNGPGTIEVYIPQWDGYDESGNAAHNNTSGSYQYVTVPYHGSQTNAQLEVIKPADENEESEMYGDQADHENAEEAYDSPTHQPSDGDPNNKGRTVVIHKRKTCNDESAFAQFITEELKLIKNPAVASDLKFKIHKLINEAINKEYE